MALLSAAIPGFSGCGKKTATGGVSSEAAYPLPDPPVVVNCDPGTRGGKLVIAQFGDPKTFNFIKQSDMASLGIIRFMFWGLLNYDEVDQEVKPGLAESWTNSPDGKTWTFRLRKNLRWSDGAPLTADDVVFTWNDLIYNPKIENSIRDPFIIDGKKFTVTKLDDLTIQVVTPEVYPPFLAEFGSVNVLIMPKHILEQSVTNGTFDSAYGVNWNQEFVGCGPYRLKEYKAGQYTILERNPYFLEVDKNGTRLPYFDNLIFPIVPDMNTLSLRFLSGESDLNDYIYPYEYDTYKAASEKEKSFTLLEPGIGLEKSFFWFNQNTGVNPKTGKPYVDPVKLSWFRNTKFRQAVSYAIDRENIINSVFSGRGTPAYGFESPGNKKWYNPNTRQFPHDPVKALKLLKEIGIEKRGGNDFLTDSNGNKIEFVFSTNSGNDARGKMAVLIAADLKKLGMNVIYQPIEFNTLLTKIDDTFDYECILLGLAPGTVNDPMDGMNVLKSSGNDHQWFPREKTPSSPWEARIDELMDAQARTLDFDQRKKYYDEVQEILGEQQPMIYTVIPTMYAAIRSDVGNVRATPLSYFRASWNAEELYFKQ